MGLDHTYTSISKQCLKPLESHEISSPSGAGFQLICFLTPPHQEVDVFPPIHRASIFRSKGANYSINLCLCFPNELTESRS